MFCTYFIIIIILRNVYFHFLICINVQDHKEEKFRAFISKDSKIITQCSNNAQGNQVKNTSNHKTNTNNKINFKETIENLNKEINEKNKKLINLEKKLKEEETKNLYLEGKIKKLENDIKILKDNEKKLKYEISLNIDPKNKTPALDAIIKKDLEIEDLRKKLSRFPFVLEEGEKLMHINLIYADFNIQNYSIICKNTDVFNQIENKIYNDYTELKSVQTYFLFNGRIIEKYKTLDENNVTDNGTIMMFKQEEDEN